MSSLATRKEKAIESITYTILYKKGRELSFGKYSYSKNVLKCTSQVTAPYNASDIFCIEPFWTYSNNKVGMLSM